MTHRDGLWWFPARSMVSRDAGASQAACDVVRGRPQVAVSVVFPAPSGRRGRLTIPPASPARPLLPKQPDTQSQRVMINARWY